LLLGLTKERVEDFSFALAVVLTPMVIAREGYRLLKAQAGSIATGGSVLDLFLPSLVGMAFSFAAGLVALRWLSRWLAGGRWHLFGYYCLFAAAVVFAANHFLR
jgi:undecaprenyl-diphosphatase